MRSTFAAMDEEMRIIPLLFISSFAFAQPTSIHYSGLGDYLVDQDGNKTTIQGHPEMTCYRPHGELHGTFQKAKGSTIWLIADRWNGVIINNWEVKIPNPVCDLK